MKHLFVPYELAILAKEKGFNEPCLASYLNTKLRWHTDGLNNSDQWLGKSITAPLYQQLVDWFREKHNIHVLPKLLSNGYCWEVTKDNMTQFYPFTTDYYVGRIETLKEAFKLI